MAGTNKKISSLMVEGRKFDPPTWFRNRAYINSMEQYKAMHKRSVEEPEKFWAEMAEELHWFKKWDNVLEYDFKDQISIKWFQGGRLNSAYNCLDRHLDTWRKNKAAII